MPDMDGFEVLRQIRADPDLRATPIVFVSVFSARTELSGEWVVAKPIDAAELRNVLAAAVRAGRSRVLVVARESLQATLEPALGELGIEHQWETSGAAAARVCGERRFEVALIDVGIRNPQAVLQASGPARPATSARGDPILRRRIPDSLGYRQPGDRGRTGPGCCSGPAICIARRSRTSESSCRWSSTQKLSSRGRSRACARSSLAGSARPPTRSCSSSATPRTCARPSRRSAPSPSS